MSLALLFEGAGCSHKKVKERLSQKDLRSKVVALIGVDGAKEAALQTEIAIVNQVIEKGTFQIIDRAAVQAALVGHPADGDWVALGHELNADYVLRLTVVEFKAETRQGYDVNEEEDSLLSTENRTPRKQKWKHYSKVKSQEGYVKLRVEFFDVATHEMAQSEATEARRIFNSRDGEIPRKLKMLEELTAQAVATYFESLP